MNSILTLPRSAIWYLLYIYFCCLLLYKHYGIGVDYNDGVPVYTFEVGYDWFETSRSWIISKRLFDFLRFI